MAEELEIEKAPEEPLLRVEQGKNLLGWLERYEEYLFGYADPWIHSFIEKNVTKENASGLYARFFDQNGVFHNLSGIDPIEDEHPISWKALVLIYEKAEYVWGELHFEAEGPKKVRVYIQSEGSTELRDLWAEKLDFLEKRENHPWEIIFDSWIEGDTFFQKVLKIIDSENPPEVPKEPLKG